MVESGALLLLAEPGMGRTTLVTRTLAEAARQGKTTRFEDFATLSPCESIAELESIVGELQDDVATRSNTVVGIDNFPAGDECDAEIQTGLLREIVLTGSMVIVSSVPEAQMLAEMLGEAPCYWSCDLALTFSEDARNCKLYEDFTHGVPTLAVALHKVMSVTNSSEAIFANPQYQDAFMDMVADCLRMGLMSEERVLRATLMLLGSGTFCDVDRVLGEIDIDLWKSLSRDVPMLGVDVAAERFSCVGASQVDAIHVAFGFLREQMVLATYAIPRVARLLVERGDVARASAVTLMDPDPARCCAMGLAWATRFIDAGEVGTVVEAVNEARGLSERGLRLVGRRSRRLPPRGARGFAELGEGGSLQRGVGRRACADVRTRWAGSRIHSIPWSKNRAGRGALGLDRRGAKDAATSAGRGLRTADQRAGASARQQRDGLSSRDAVHAVFLCHGFGA